MLNIEECWFCSRFVLMLSILFTIEPTYLKKSYSLIPEKHQTFINLANVFNFIC